MKNVMLMQAIGQEDPPNAVSIQTSPPAPKFGQQHRGAMMATTAMALAIGLIAT